MSKVSIFDLVHVHLNYYVGSELDIMLKTDSKLSNLEAKALLPFFASDLGTEKAYVYRTRDGFQHSLAQFMLHPAVRPNNPLPEEAAGAIQKHVDIAAKYIVDEAVIPVYCNDYNMIFITDTESVIVTTDYRPIDLYRAVFAMIYETFVRRCNQSEKDTFRVMMPSTKNPYLDMVRDKIQKNQAKEKQKTLPLPKNLPEDNEVPFSQVMQEVDFKALSKTLKSQVIGHDHNVDEIIKVLQSRRMCLNQKSPPSFMFAGISGTGKTQLALELATALGFHCERMDMSEYMEYHSVSRIIGAPNGYIGNGNPGVLDNCSNAFTVVIVDELEKAHEDVMNIFLQALDYSVITTGTGKQIDFSKCIFIFTTNLGAKDVTTNRIEISPTKTSLDSDIRKSINLALKTELINRFSKILTFGSLTNEDMGRVFDLIITKYQAAVRKNHSIDFEIDKSFKEILLNESITNNSGVRPLDRNILTEVMEPISDVIWGLRGPIVIETKKGNIRVEPFSDSEKDRNNEVVSMDHRRSHVTSGAGQRLSGS